MVNKKVIGKAYAFIDYEKESSRIIASLEKNRAKANFPENLEFIVLKDNLNKSVIQEKEKLPTKFEQVSRDTNVYGEVPLDMVGNVIGLKPKRASNLRYIIMAKASGVTDNEYTEPLGQARANMVTAGMLNQVISFLGTSECLAGQRKYLRAVVFYKDGHGKIQRYI
jgi:hypothetical protein